MKLALVAVVALIVACSDHDRTEIKRDPERQHRVIEPPSRGVRALPPHAIRADGVGPYRLGASLAELLDQLPSGPRVAQFDIPGVVHRSILRAEEDAILIGGEPQGRASFVAVVGGEVARTESGIHVGSTRDELVRALGAPVEDVDRARDPRIVVPTALRNAHVLFDGDRIVAIVVTGDGGSRATPARDAGVETGCQRPTPDREKLEVKSSAHVFGACLTATGELVESDGDELTVIGAESEKPITATRVPGMVFASALRSGVDARDEIVAITHTDEATTRSWSLVAYRLDGTRLVKSIDSRLLYQLTVENARWIGADLKNLELYLELTSHPDSIEAGGLLATRIGDKLRDIAVISPFTVPRGRAKSAPPELTDAGTSDAVAQPTAPTSGSASP